MKPVIDYGDRSIKADPIHKYLLYNRFQLLQSFVMFD